MELYHVVNDLQTERPPAIKPEPGRNNSTYMYECMLIFTYEVMIMEHHLVRIRHMYYIIGFTCVQEKIL